MSIDDEVFGRSTISYFIERVGDDGLKVVFVAFNQELMNLGLLSSQVYATSTLVRANVSYAGLEKTNKKTEKFIEEVYKENELFVLKESKEGEDGSLRGDKIVSGLWR